MLMEFKTCIDFGRNGLRDWKIEDGRKELICTLLYINKACVISGGK
jgi:hypothetical protein